MQSPVLFFAFATFILGVAGQVSSRDDHSDDTAAFGTIHVTFQCDSNGPECKEGAPTPIMLQMIDDAKKETCSKDYVQDDAQHYKESHFRTIGKIEFHDSANKTKDFRLDGDHIYRGPPQPYNFACTAAMGTNTTQQSYNLDVQNKQHDFSQAFDKGGPNVKCWSSLPTDTREKHRFNQTYSLYITHDCPAGSVEKPCDPKDVSTPNITYMKEGLMTTASKQDPIGYEIATEPEKSIIGPKAVRLAKIDFDYPTFSDATKLPEPAVFWMDTYRCEVRILRDPLSVGAAFSDDKISTMGDFELDESKDEGGMVYCYEEPFVPYKGSVE